MTYLNFNGSILTAGTAILTADNPGFRYGDGLFETIRIEERRIMLAGHHFDRLFAGAQVLGFELSAFPSRSDLTASILDLCEKNGHGTLARVRLAIFRHEGGLHAPGSDVPAYVIQTWPLANPQDDPTSTHGTNAIGLVLGLFPDGRKSCDPYSNLKSNNYLLYSQAAAYARRQGWDDCLVLNSLERIADSSISNLFYCLNGKLFTPPLAEGCVAGVMRRYLLEILPGAGFDISEKAIEPGELLSAGEVFLSNAIRRIRRVGRFMNTVYDHELTDAIDVVLNKSLQFSS